MFFKKPDHDLSVLSVSKTSTEWRHGYACPLCKAEVGHQEFMTDICLTCGRVMPVVDRAAVRKVTRNGKWINTIRIYDKEYQLIKNQPSVLLK